jgi:hypothetical protein
MITRITASLALMLFSMAAVAQTPNKPLIPPPFTDEGYSEGEFRADITCSNGMTSAVLQKDARSTISLTTTTDGKRNVVTLFRSQPNMMDTCFYSLICRNVSKRLKVIAREDPACGRMGNDPIYHAVDAKTFKYERINSKTADSLGLEVELLNYQDSQTEKIFKTEVGEQLFATINIYLASNEGPAGLPSDMLAASMPKQPNTFFSGKDHILVFASNGKPEFVKGRFKGKGFNGAWTGSANGVNYLITTKKTAEGEDAITGIGSFKLGSTHKITWAHGEFP